MTKIATWNVNSVRARLPRVLEWLKEANPDIVLLQEIKCLDDGFPRMEIEELGYNIATAGQKSLNGVAILAKQPIEDVTRGLPGDPSDTQSRYIEAFVGDVRVASIYLPNGNPVMSEKFPYKLTWMKRLIERARELVQLDEAVVLGGDYNVCPTDEDVYNPILFANDALCRSETRALYRSMMNLGLTDAFRVLNPGERGYSFWDYTAGAWQKNWGLRLDHLLLSPPAADRLAAAGIDKAPRGREKASDHTPVWCELEAPQPATGIAA
jgi:exodeoxyribonuclease-3